MAKYLLICGTSYFIFQLVLNPEVAALSSKGVRVNDIVPLSMRGMFREREELDEYERTWHLYIYQPTWDELKSKVRRHRCIVRHIEILL